MIPKAKPKKRVIAISEEEDVFGSSPIKKISKPKKFQVYSSDEDDDDVKVCVCFV